MSSSTNSNRSVLWATVALAALVALPAISQAAPPPKVAAVSVAPGSVSWAPQVNFAKLVLTVSGGGYTQTFEFEGAPFFTPVDDEGYLLPDGSYTWQLTVIPRPLDLNESTFRNAKVSEDGRVRKAAEYPPGLTQSGTFTISRGAIVNPDLVEVEEGAAVPASEAAAPESAAVDDSDGGQ